MHVFASCVRTIMGKKFATIHLFVSEQTYKFSREENNYFPHHLCLPVFP